jgi:hypothetical protein
MRFREYAAALPVDIRVETGKLRESKDRFK